MSATSRGVHTCRWGTSHLARNWEFGNLPRENSEDLSLKRCGNLKDVDRLRNEGYTNDRKITCMLVTNTKKAGALF